MSNWKVMLVRAAYNDKQVKGMAEVRDGDGKFRFAFYTLELPWMDNAVRKSCIPHGTYECRRRNSPKYGHHWHVQDVEGRSLILIHHGNYNHETMGCILVGRDLVDLNGDGLLDTTASAATMNELRKLLPDSFQLEIIS